MTSTVKPGIYFDMPPEEYHSDPTPNGSLSSTWARKLMEPAGPAKFHHERLNPPPPKKVFEFGEIAHGMVLGTGPDPVVYPEEVLSKTGTTGTDKARAFAAEARAKGLIPMKQAEVDQITAMAEAIKSHPEAMALLTEDGIRTEVSSFRIDPETGMWLRARFDAISPTGIVDYKTIVDADPARFARKTAHELGYHQQDAWYREQAQALGLTDGPLRFILQEKTAPYLVSVVQLDDDYLAVGRGRNRAAIDLYARCLATDTWPGYTGTHLVGPPAWLTDASTPLDEGMAAELAAYADRLAAEAAVHTKENAA